MSHFSLVFFIAPQFYYSSLVTFSHTALTYIQREFGNMELHSRTNALTAKSMWRWQWFWLKCVKNFHHRIRLALSNVIWLQSRFEQLFSLSMFLVRINSIFVLTIVSVRSGHSHRFRITYVWSKFFPIVPSLAHLESMWVRDFTDFTCYCSMACKAMVTFTLNRDTHLNKDVIIHRLESTDKKQIIAIDLFFAPFLTFHVHTNNLLSFFLELGWQ